MWFIELSHPIENGMPAYPGFPSPQVGAFLTHEESRPRYRGYAEFYIGRVEMVGNTATYLDSPFHRYPDREDLSRIALEQVAGLEGLVLDAALSPRAVALNCHEEVMTGRAVLVRTGWDTRWGSEAYWQPGPYLSDTALDLLLRARPALVGVDFWNVDDPDNPARPAHTRLLDAGILIVENLANLGALPAWGFRFYAVPPCIVGGASFPVRAFAEVNEA